MVVQNPLLGFVYYLAGQNDVLGGFYWILTLGWNVYRVSPWSEFLVSSFKTVKNRLINGNPNRPLIFKAVRYADVIT